MSTNSKTEIEEILKTFFHHQVVIKMYHFQTKFYGSHKASDSYLSTFLGHFDTFMEVAQGTWGTVNTDYLNLMITTVNDKTITKYLNEYISFLNSFEDLLGSGRTDLLNLRDEMKSEAHKFKYLLHFK